MKKILLILSLFSFSGALNAQFFEIGAGLSANWYKGDFQDWSTRPRFGQFLEIKPGFNGYFGFQNGDRFLYKLGLNLDRIGISKNNYGYSGNGFNNTTFSTNLIGLIPSVEYIFFDYSSDKHFTNWSPYLSIGLNLLSGKPSSSPSFFSFGANFGVGAMLEIKKNLGIKAQVLTTKTFTDRLDGFANPVGGSMNDISLKKTDRLVQFQIMLTYKMHKIFCPREL